MITSLTLRNFQAHSKLVLELDPHVTTIVGPSDQGKSSVLRALRWLALNSPSGAAFVKEGEDSARVVVEADGRRVRRERSGRKNAYKLDGKAYAAFGNDVPRGIARLLSLGPINFQGQHDAPFWFADTPGEVSRKLNELVDLKIIDRVLTTLGGGVRRHAHEVQFCQQRRQDARAKRDALAGVPGMDEELQGVEALGERIDELESRVQALGRLVDVARWQSAGSTGWLEVFVDGDRLLGSAGEMSAARERAGNLERNIGDARQHQVNARPAPTQALGELEGRGRELRRAEGRAGEIQTLIDQAREFEATMGQQDRRRSQLAKELESKIGKVCPLCQRPTSRPPSPSSARTSTSHTCPPSPAPRSRTGTRP